MGMRAAYHPINLVGARMVFRSEQGAYDCEPLGCDSDPALTASRDKFVQSLNGVLLAPPSIHQPEFSHKRLQADFNTARDNNHVGGNKDMTADRTCSLQVQPIPALTCYLQLSRYHINRDCQPADQFILKGSRRVRPRSSRVLAAPADV